MRRYQIVIGILVISLSAGYLFWYQIDLESHNGTPPTSNPEATADSPDLYAVDQRDATVLDSVPQISEANNLDQYQALFSDPLDQLRRLEMDTSESGIRATLSDQTQSGEARYWSAIALGKSKSANAIYILKQILENEDNTDMQIGAINGLAYLDNPQAKQILEDIINYHPDTSVRRSVISALIRNPSTSTHELVGSIVINPLQEIEVRSTALEYLALIDSPTMANTMRTLLADNSPELRAKAAVALSRQNYDEATAHLVSAAQNDDLPIVVWDSVVRELQASTEGSVEVLSAKEYFSNLEAQSKTKREIDRWWKNRGN